MRRGAEEGQSITHADRMRPEATQSAHSGTDAAGVEKDTHSPSRGRRRAGRDTGRAGGHRTRSQPPRGSQRAQERHGAQIPTHRAKMSHSRQG